MEKVCNTIRRVQNRIVRRCDSCKVYWQRPKIFKIALRADKYFNHTVYTYIFYIKGKPILHVVDESTRYQAVRLHKSVSSEVCGDSYGFFR